MDRLEEMEAMTNKINVTPDKIQAMRLTASYKVEIVKVKGQEVTIRVKGWDYTLSEGDTFNFDLEIG